MFLLVQIAVNCFIQLLLIKGNLSYDIWNDIPCHEEYHPKNCDLDKLDLVTVDDFDRCAPARLPLSHRNYFLGASGRRESYKENKNAFRRIKIIPNVFKDLSNNQLRTKVLGLEVDFPIGLSPVAMHKLAHPHGELATVSGLSNKKTIMILSSYATSSIEDVAQQAKGTPLHLWQQTYIFTNRSLTVDHVRRAEKNGFKAIVLTTDANIEAKVTCNARRNVQLPPGVSLVNIGKKSHGIFAESASFKDITWLKTVTSLPIVAKGILSGADATRAVMAGASAILVSNHGGRQVDGTPATIDVLPGVVEAMNRLHPPREVFMDGGVRSGRDVFKALARGAKMVFVGRPTVWGLAINGAKGVQQMITILEKELNETMLLSGFLSPSEIRKDSLVFKLPTGSEYFTENFD